MPLATRYQLLEIARAALSTVSFRENTESRFTSAVYGEKGSDANERAPEYDSPLFAVLREMRFVHRARVKTMQHE